MSNKQCGVNECKNKYYAKGYCEKHYQRKKHFGTVEDRKGHHGRGLEKFWDNIDKNGESITPVGTPCWLWLLGKHNHGYGRIYMNGKDLRAHCFSWELHNDKKIPKGMQICHKCDTPACVNPEHLFLGTSLDNARDRNNKGRTNTGDHRGEKCGRAKLTELQVLSIRADDKSNREIAKEYNIDYSSVSDIKRRKTWKHI